MKQTINQNMFMDAFEKAGRGDQFSYDGLQSLFEYLEELELDTNEEMELDVVAICCDFTEYDTALEAAEGYGWEAADEDREEQEEAAIEWLGERTLIINAGSGIIIQNF